MCHLGGLLLQAIRVAVPAALVAAIAGTDTVNAMLASIPEVITRGLQVAGGFIVVVGYAMVINMMNAKSLMPFFFLGFLVAVFTNVNLIGFGAFTRNHKNFWSFDLNARTIAAYFHIKGLQRDIAIEEAAKTGGPSAAGGTGLDDIDDSDLM